MSPAKTKKSVVSLLLFGFLTNNTETACGGEEVYNTVAIVVKPALLELFQKKRWADSDTHWVIGIASFARV